MLSQNLALLLAISGAYATPISKRDECSDKCSAAYNTCRGQPNANRAQCAADYSSCLGYLPFNDEGSLVTPTACSVTATATATAQPTTDACVEKCNSAYNSCRTAPQANMSFCAAKYSECLGYLPFNDQGSLVTPTACSSTAGPTVTPTAVPAPAPTPAAPQSAQVEGWTVKDLTRYCAEDRSGCDYNFKISTNDGQEDASCTVIRIDVENAPEESWYAQPCTAGSPYQISWGYSTQFETPFAVLTVVDTTKNAQAYFGVNDPTGQPVTPSNPYGSGNFGNIGPQPVSYN